MKCARCAASITAAGCECSFAQRLEPPRSCACCHAAHVPGSNFCGQCGASYADAVQVEPGSTVERRQVTFVFCDLIGSTALSHELDPEDYKDILLSYRQCLSRAMREFDGRVERYRGDGTLIYFGYPDAHEDDAERAVHAALKALQAIGEVALPNGRRLEARLGISTGIVVIDDVDESTDRAAMGDAPNMASKLQTVAEPNSIVVDETTRRLLGSLFEFREWSTFVVKGIEGPLKAWQVTGVTPQAGRFEAHHGQTPVPLIGRDIELQRLVEWWDTARQGMGRIALISGDAGIGKSRLAAALLQQTSQQHCTVFRYFLCAVSAGIFIAPVHSTTRTRSEIRPFGLAGDQTRKVEPGAERRTA
jgi:class 3 adenylate cyclase